jgi:hypothetical protein
MVGKNMGRMVCVLYEEELLNKLVRSVVMWGNCLCGEEKGVLIMQKSWLLWLSVCLFNERSMYCLRPQRSLRQDLSLTHRQCPSMINQMSQIWWVAASFQCSVSKIRSISRKMMVYFFLASSIFRVTMLTASRLILNSSSRAYPRSAAHPPDPRGRIPPPLLRLRRSLVSLQTYSCIYKSLV